MRDPVALRKRAGTSGNPRRDQYFLEDTRVLDRIISYANDVDHGLSDVLEIGPGVGSLTARLLDSGGQVTAIERDASLVRFLKQEFSNEINDDRLTLMQGDALDISYPDYSSCVSNLPYGVASELLFRLLPRERPIVVMVQREFGERMAAATNTAAYGRLSVTAQHYGEVQLCETVPPSVFQPQPPVESAIVRVTPRDPLYSVPDETFFMALVRAMFTQRRKTLRNAIRNTTHISGIQNADILIDELNDDLLGKRPGELSPATFARIATIAWELEKYDD